MLGGAGSVHITSQGVTVGTSSSTNPVNMTSFQLQTSNSGYGAVIDITGRTTNYLNIIWLGSLIVNAASVYSTQGVTGIISTTTLTGLRFTLIGGYTFSGTFKLYGYQD